MPQSDQNRFTVIAAKLYSLLTLGVLALAPACLMAYVAFLPGADAKYDDMAFHVLAIGIATAEGLFISFVSWRCYLQSGEPFLRWLTLGFLGFTVIYAPHGAFTYMSHHNMWLFILYGPASRFAMACLLVKASLVYGSNAVDTPERRRAGWGIWVALFLAVNVAVGVLAYSPIAGEPWVRLSMEVAAACLSSFSCLVLLSRRISQPLMHNYILATAFFAQSSISFVMAKVWNHQWWLAHIIFASGFLLVSYGVMRAFLTTGAFSTVYSYEQIMQRLKEELQARSRAEQEIADRENKLIEAHSTLLLAADVAHLGTWSWNLADNAVQWNAQMYKLFGRPQAVQGEALRYESWRSFLHPDDIAETEAMLSRAVAGDGQFDPVFRIIRSDGSIRFVQAGAFVERDAAGKPVRVVGINFDVTERKEFETSLLEAKRLAEEATLAKGQFLANMSHEIRTPMNAVLGMLQLLRQTRLDLRQADYAAKAQTAARSLLGLLNDILDYSKIDAGKMELDTHPFEVEQLMRDLAVVLSGNLGEKQVELVFDIDPALPAQLVGDRMRLQQVLINLAGNALKFTPQGHVLISLDLPENQLGNEGHDGGHILLRVTVADTGIGIAPEQIARIFDGFTQAEASTTRRFGGTGLGLAISRRLVALMGGEMHIDSTPGVGSRFWFEIGLQLPGGLVPAAAMARTERRILLAEGHALAARMLHKSLAAHGWQVEQAAGGAQALSMSLDAMRRGEPFDAVVMDKRLHDIDGLTVARMMHKEAGAACPPVILMGMAVDREQAAANPDTTAPPVFADFLTKPLTPGQLQEAIEAAIARPGLQRHAVDNKSGEAGSAQRAETSGDARPTVRRLEGMRVLVVEDNPLNRQVVQELLQSEGARVTLAEGGLPGVALATRAVGMFDLVVMDVQMPDIDGLEATRRIRADRRFASLPILAMTANATTADRAECLEAGMNEHVAKPIDIDEVVPMILALTGHGRHGGHGGHAAAPPALAAHSSTDAAGLLEPLDKVLQRFGGQRQIYRTALASFDTECETMASRLMQVAQGGTANELARAMHVLKGIAATVGATALAREAEELESTALAEPAPDMARLFNPDTAARLLALMRHSRDQLHQVTEGGADGTPHARAIP